MTLAVGAKVIKIKMDLTLAVAYHLRRMDAMELMEVS